MRSKWQEINLLRAVTIAGAVVIPLASQLFAQSPSSNREEYGNLAGRVYGPGGRALAGARVLLVGAHRSITFNTVTDESGGFDFKGLPAGPSPLFARTLKRSIAELQGRVPKTGLRGQVALLAAVPQDVTSSTCVSDTCDISACSIGCVATSAGTYTCRIGCTDTSVNSCGGTFAITCQGSAGCGSTSDGTFTCSDTCSGKVTCESDGSLCQNTEAPNLTCGTVATCAVLTCQFGTTCSGSTCSDNTCGQATCSGPTCGTLATCFLACG